MDPLRSESTNAEWVRHSGPGQPPQSPGLGLGWQLNFRVGDGVRARVNHTVIKLFVIQSWASCTRVYFAGPELDPFGQNIFVRCWNSDRIFEWTFFVKFWADFMIYKQTQPLCFGSNRVQGRGLDSVKIKSADRKKKICAEPHQSRKCVRHEASFWTSKDLSSALLRIFWTHSGSRWTSKSEAEFIGVRIGCSRFCLKRSPDRPVLGSW